MRAENAVSQMNNTPELKALLDNLLAKKAGTSYDAVEHLNLVTVTVPFDGEYMSITAVREKIPEVYKRLDTNFTPTQALIKLLTLGNNSFGYNKERNPVIAHHQSVISFLDKHITKLNK